MDMNLVCPKIPARLLLPMMGYALLGAIIAGLFGVAHDQITFSISPEYFTRLKFAQFHYADFGLSPRVFVAEIGFLATWWVGFIAGWFLARVAVPSFPAAETKAHCLRGFAIIFVCAMVAAILGFGLGLLRGPDANDSSWQGFANPLGIVDLPSFVRVAYIHNASYLGGLVGLIIAVLYLRRLRPRDASPMRQTTATTDRTT